LPEKLPAFDAVAGHARPTTRNRLENPFRPYENIKRTLASRNPAEMGGRSRDRIFGDKLRAAKIRLESAKSQSRVVDSRIAAAECELWSAQMEGYGGPAQPSPTIAQAVSAGYFYLEVKCRRCNHHGAVDLRLLRRQPNTEIWRLEASLSCEECRAGHRWKANVHMIKLSRLPDTSTPWYAPDETDRH
jgi:hypothetical protein